MPGIISSFKKRSTARKRVKSLRARRKARPAAVDRARERARKKHPGVDEAEIDRLLGAHPEVIEQELARGIRRGEGAGLGQRAQEFAFGVGGKRLGQAFTMHPLLTTGAVGLGGLFAKEAVIDPLAGGIAQGAKHMVGVDTPYDRMREAFETQRQSQYAQMQQMQQLEQEKRVFAQASAALASRNPHLYNQIMAGRQLPQGAVVLGGSPQPQRMEDFLRQQLAPQGMGPMMGPGM